MGHKAASKSTPDIARAAVVAIDPAARDAQKQIRERFPKVVVDATIDAPSGASKAAARYLSLGAEIKRLSEEREICANALCLAIGANAAIEDDSFRASWANAQGQVDWPKIAEDYKIPDGVIEKYRKEGGRTLRVTSKVA